MAVLTADTELLHQTDDQLKGYPVADNVLIYKYSWVCIDPTGHAVPAADVAGYTAVGAAERHYDNTVAGHSAGAFQVNCWADQVFKGVPIASVNQADVGQSLAYIQDSGTLTKTPNNYVAVGLIVGYVDATHCDVYVPPPSFPVIAASGVPLKMARVPLQGGVDTPGGVGSWQNPEGVGVWVERLIVTSQETGGHVATAAFNLDAGATATSATTLADNLIDGQDFHTALVTVDNLTAPGTNGKQGQYVANGKWVTFSTGDATASAGFAGVAFIIYRPLH